MMDSESPLQSLLAGRKGTNLASFDEVRGFLFAVAGAPELVPPSEWLPEAFGGEMPEFESKEQGRAILEELMGQHNSVNAGGRRMMSQAPAFRKETTSNLEEDAPIGRWSRGFVRGYSWLRDVWSELTPEDLEDELASIILVLSFFASRRMAAACSDEMEGGKSLDEIAEIMRRTFKDAMAGYVRLGRSICQAHLQYERASAATEAKTGRNEPCPCGSGMKYKRCCGAPSN